MGTKTSAGVLYKNREGDWSLDLQLRREIFYPMGICEGDSGKRRLEPVRMQYNDWRLNLLKLTLLLILSRLQGTLLYSVR